MIGAGGPGTAAEGLGAAGQPPGLGPGTPPAPAQPSGRPEPEAGRPLLAAGNPLRPAGSSRRPLGPACPGSESRPGLPRPGSAPALLRSPHRPRLPGLQRQSGGPCSAPGLHPAVGAARIPFPRGKSPVSRDLHRSRETGFEVCSRT